MKIHLDSPTEDVQIQVVPLIDVIFCILTFFILAALQFTGRQGIELNLPRSQTGTTATREMMVVTVSPSGLTLVNNNPQPVDRSQLRQILQAYRQQQPEGLFVLNASRNALYEEVIQVLDLLREVGGNVALATLPAESNQLDGATSPTTSPTLSPFPGQPLSPTLNPSDVYPIPLPTGSGTTPGISTPPFNYQPPVPSTTSPNSSSSSEKPEKRSD
jgi:biopolymer transport protein ExbD